MLPEYQVYALRLTFGFERAEPFGRERTGRDLILPQFAGN